MPRPADQPADQEQNDRGDQRDDCVFHMNMRRSGLVAGHERRQRPRLYDKIHDSADQAYQSQNIGDDSHRLTGSFRRENHRCESSILRDTFKTHSLNWASPNLNAAAVVAAH